MAHALASGSIVEKTRHYIPFIDGLRGFAILAVLAVHIGQYVGTATAGFRVPLIQQFVDSGARGVQLFFMVSAFTLFASTRRRMDSDRRPVLSFYLRRAFRILPAWWLAVYAYSLLGERTLAQALPSYLMYFGFFLYKPGLDVVYYGWSIFVEETFYVLMPLVMGIFATLARAVGMFLVLFVAAFCWKIGAPALGVSDDNNFIYFFPLSHWFCFAMGFVIYHVWQSEAFRELMRKKESALILDVLAAAMLVDLIRIHHRTAVFALTAIFFAASHERSLIGRLARAPLIMRFGQCCFSIYLMHGMLLQGLEIPLNHERWSAALSNLPAEVIFPLAYPLLALGLLALGLLSFRLLEMPAVNAGRAVIARLNAKTAT